MFMSMLLACLSSTQHFTDHWNISPSAVRTTLTSSAYQITNTSAEVFACEILGDETSPLSGVGQHARGDCETPEGSGGFVLPVEKSTLEYDEC